MYIRKNQAERLGLKYNINLEVVPFEEWHDGLNIELEHGKKHGSITNITNDSLGDTAKIVIAHLIEDPRYYYFLKKQEIKREKYWSKRMKPHIFN
ncbi:MAG: hypothetical protein RLZZ546_1746 [Bacteroidota bacterium]|jgi:hypothetical protein